MKDSAQDSYSLLVRQIAKYVAIGGAVVALAIVIFGASSLVEKVNADEVVLVQDLFDGELHWYTTAGMKPQFFGRVTRYPKRDIYTFENRIRFNEGGHGTMFGSIQYELPLDPPTLTRMHEQFGSAQAVQAQLVQVVTDKSVYMTGPLLSSKESYAEKRTSLITWVEDQIVNGIYRTTQRDEREVDPLTGEETTVTIVEIVQDENGMPARSEPAQLTGFGIRPFNFAVTEIRYDQDVEAQIQSQQKNIMAVQTAIAEARQAEQRALTVEQQGKANAAAAKWEQEVEKARRVTEAEQRLEVARLDRQAADEERQRQIMLGQGEAERKRLVMNADGALQQKLDAFKEVNFRYADAIAAYTGNWMPQVVMGGQSGSGAQGANVAGGGAVDLINLLMAQTARDLALDFRASGVRQTAGSP